MSYAMTYPQRSSRILNLPNTCSVTRSGNSEFYIARISRELTFRDAKRFSFVKHHDGLLLHFLDGAIEINALESSVSSLKKAVCDELVFMWNWYANEEDANLTDNAKRIKQWLLSNIEAV